MLDLKFLRSPELKRLALFFFLVGIPAGLLFAYEFYLLGTMEVREAELLPALRLAPPEGLRVAILRSETTARFLGTGEAYQAHATYWGELLTANRIASDFISDQQLEGELTPYRVVVLPSAVCLSAAQKRNLRNFLRAGNGVIATWATGTRDERGMWKDWDFLRELTGAVAFELKERPAPWYVSFYGGTPLAAGPATAARAQITSPERVEATSLAVDAYWSDFTLFPIDPQLPETYLGAAIRRQHESGRAVWFGFQENAAAGGGHDKLVLDSVLVNAVLWAGQGMMGEVSPWPTPHDSAVVIALNVANSSENARYAAQRLLRRQAAGTFYCTGAYVRESGYLMRTLNYAGEVGSQGETDEPFTRLSLNDQLVSLWQSRVTLWRLSGRWAVGFHPPDDIYDPQTLRALAGARYRYYQVGPEGYSALPQRMRVSQRVERFERERELVRLSRMTHDDRGLSPLGLTGLEPDWIVQRVVFDSGIVRALGGLYILSMHSQGLSAPEYVDVLTPLVEHWRAHSVWLATAGEVADWWQRRARLNVLVTDWKGRSFLLSVRSTSPEAVDDVGLTFYPPAGYDTAEVKVRSGSTSARIEPDVERGRFRLVLGRLEPNISYRFEVTLVP
jgi:peptidoglycan/xylan/chitin deacetylase (PgdA/CDA1 family)